jgi:glycerol kinase
MPRTGKEHVLGLDEGTTGVRAAVVDARCSIVAESYLELSVAFPKPGWVEQDANGIWAATQEVAKRALSSAGIAPGDLAGVGITNQRGSAVVFERSGRPIGPVLTWQDQRTTARCIELLGKGLFILPMTAATKYEWLVREHGPGIARGDLRCGTIDTWLASRLSGGVAHATDHSNLSSSGVYDLVGGGYDARVVEELALDPSWLPEIVQTSAILGETDASVFGARVPIASLAGDQHAAMYAQACHAPGSVKLSLGTSGMMQLHAGTELGAPGPGAYPLVLWSLDGTRQFCHEGATLTAGAAAQWLRDGLGIVTDVRQLEALARSVPSTEGVWAVPSFGGLGTPHLDLDARGIVGGLSRGSSRAHVARAVLEGIAWRSAEVLDSLGSTLPERPARIRVDGGASTNDLLLEMLADFGGVAVERPVVHESAVLGAALLAGRAVGLWTDREVAASWRADHLFEPRLGADERATRRERWNHLVKITREAGH